MLLIFDDRRPRAGQVWVAVNEKGTNLSLVIKSVGLAYDRNRRDNWPRVDTDPYGFIWLQEDATMPPCWTKR